MTEPVVRAFIAYDFAIAEGSNTSDSEESRRHARPRMAFAAQPS